MKKYIPYQLTYPLRRMKRRILLELNRPTGFNKTDLIHLISKRLKLRNYLELCTPTAGRRYGEIDRARFRTARRLMYIVQQISMMACRSTIRLLILISKTRSTELKLGE